MKEIERLVGWLDIICKKDICSQHCLGSMQCKFSMVMRLSRALDRDPQRNVLLLALHLNETRDVSKFVLLINFE